MNYIAKRASLNKLYLFGFCLLLSIVFITFFSYTTSPIHENPGYVDSIVFQLIGKYWAKGFIPYIDLWDLKGPVVFFVNAVGYFLCGSKIGVYLIQIINLTIVLYLIYKFLSLDFDYKKSLLYVFIILCGFFIGFEEGNTVEEYILPFLMLAYYGIYQWTIHIEKGDFVHSPKYAFLYGFILAFALLSRLTNAFGICLIILCIVITLIAKKEFKNLMHNVYSFILGFIVLFLPFCLYFFLKGALYEMWYGTIFYNLEYANNSVESLSFIDVLHSLSKFFSCTLLIVVGFLVAIFNVKRRKIGLMWILLSFLSFFLLIKINGFKHYGIVTFPFFCISFLEMKKLKMTVNNLYMTNLLRVIIVLMIILFIKNAVGSSIQSYRYLTKKSNNTCNVDVMKMIPYRERIHFIAYNCKPSIYLENDIKPCYRYFVFQDFEISRGKSLLPRILKEYSQCKAKWILVNDGGNIISIRRILNEKYKLFYVEPSSKLKLYKLSR